jgi:MoaA/NifB/PqqE/SkfB family radical SAM enzyme
LFFLFTNGTLLTDRHVQAIADAPNILPILSLEGDQALTDFRRGDGVAHKVGLAMDRLREADMLFGFASVVTHINLSRVTSRAWLDRLWEVGARFGFLIDYIPFPDGLQQEWVLTEEDLERKVALVAERYEEARPLVINFPPDEYSAGICQAAGRGFVHINADGFVEPCPFSHFAADNVLEKPLEEILASPFMSQLRQMTSQLPNPHGECVLFKHRCQVEGLTARTGGFSTEHLPSRSP